MTKKNNLIEVFQDLTLLYPCKLHAEICEALRQRTKAPWRRSEDEELSLRDQAFEDSEFMVFIRESGDNLKASKVGLHGEPGTYKISNVVPMEYGQLEVSEYNDILNDFVDQIVRPISKDIGPHLHIDISKRKHSMKELTSPNAAKALRIFLSMSYGTSHPNDEKRWIKFLIEAHTARRKLDANLLRRWFVEVERPPKSVDDLVHEYEFALDLLKEYDLFLL